MNERKGGLLYLIDSVGLERDPMVWTPPEILGRGLPREISPAYCWLASSYITISKLYPRTVQKNLRRTANCTPLAFTLRTFKIYVVATSSFTWIHYVAHRKYWTVVRSRKSSGALFSTKGQLRNLSGGEFTGPRSSPYKIARTPLGLGAHWEHALCGTQRLM